VGLTLHPGIPHRLGRGMAAKPTPARETEARLALGRRLGILRYDARR
jgi:hypothetical protein